MKPVRFSKSGEWHCPKCGTLAKGKVADFLVLQKNPLDDIVNTRTLSAVYIKGQKFDCLCGIMAREMAEPSAMVRFVFLIRASSPRLLQKFRPPPPAREGAWQGRRFAVFKNAIMRVFYQGNGNI